MISGMKKRWSVLLAILVISVLTTSCSSEGLDKLWLKSEGWSRGLLLGSTAMASPTEPVVDDDGQVYAILFPRINREDRLYQPVLVRVNKLGTEPEEIPLDFQIAQPRAAQLVLNNDSFDLFWIDSNQLKSVTISPQGELLSDTRRLSVEERVDHFDLIIWDGQYNIWYSGSQEKPGIYALVGELDDLEKSIVDPDGIRGNLFLDGNDNLHVTWARYPISYGDLEFFYLQTSPLSMEYPDPDLMYTSGVSPSVKVDGPVLGLDEEVGYIVWSEAIVSGLDAGRRTTYYRYFPLNEPEKIRPQMTVRVPYVANLPADEFDYGAFQTGDRVPLFSGIPSTSNLENIALLEGVYGETPLVFRARSEFKWRDFRNQINVAYFSDGLLTSYQPLSYTSAESYYPTIVNDREGNLYITWLEKGEFTYRAYLTTTNPAIKTTLDKVTTEDYLYLAAEGIFGMLAGVVLSPFAAAAWGGIGLIGMIFNFIFAQFNRPVYRRIGEVLSILASIGVYWFMKWVTLPGLQGGTYVPFSAWIPRIPESIQQPLVIGVPVLIALIALSVAYFKTYGKKTGSPINFHMLYCAVDALLSCAVYGVLIYGSF